MQPTSRDAAAYPETHSSLQYFRRPRPRWRHWLLWTVIVCTWLSQSSYGQHTNSSIAVSNTPLSLPFYVAAHQGYFTEQGINVTLIPISGGHRAIQHMLDSEADYATVSDAVIAFRSLKEQPFEILTTFVHSDDDLKIVVGPQHNATHLSALDNARIGTTLGSAGHYFLDMVMLVQGLAPSRVTLVSLQPEQLPSALQQGSVDAVAAWEPYPFQILKAQSGSRLINVPRFYHLTFNLVRRVPKTAERTLTRNNDIRLLRALQQAIRFIHHEPRLAQQILKHRLNLQQGFVDWIWPRYFYGLKLDHYLLATLENQVRWLQDDRATARHPNFLHMIDSHALHQVAPSAVRVVH